MAASLPDGAVAGGETRAGDAAATPAPASEAAGPEDSSLSLNKGGGGHVRPKFVIDADVGSLSTMNVRRPPSTGKPRSAEIFTRRFGSLTLKPHSLNNLPVTGRAVSAPREHPVWNDSYWKAAQLTEGRDDDVYFGPSVWLREESSPVSDGPLAREAPLLRPEGSARSGRGTLRTAGARPLSQHRLGAAPGSLRSGDGGGGGGDSAHLVRRPLG